MTNEKISHNAELFLIKCRIKKLLYILLVKDIKMINLLFFVVSIVSSKINMDINTILFKAALVQQIRDTTYNT